MNNFFLKPCHHIASKTVRRFMIVTMFTLLFMSSPAVGKHSRLPHCIVNSNGVHFKYYNVQANSVELKSNLDLWTYRYKFQKQLIILNPKTKHHPPIWNGYWTLSLPWHVFTIKQNSHNKKINTKFSYQLIINHVFINESKTNANNLESNQLPSFSIPKQFLPQNKNPMIIPGKFKGLHRFIYRSGPKHPIYLTGDFNNWKTKNIPLKYQGNDIWSVEIQLLPGSYRYHFFNPEKFLLNDILATTYNGEGFPVITVR